MSLSGAIPPPQSLKRHKEDLMIQIHQKTTLPNPTFDEH
jgi:hypothetical protein